MATRWNSLLRLVQADTDLDPQSLNILLENERHKNLCLTGREFSQLKELVEILGPFLHATDLTQAEKLVTVSAALPSILSLNSHLNSIVYHLRGLVKTLQQSLQCRLQAMIFFFFNVTKLHNLVFRPLRGSVIIILYIYLNSNSILFLPHRLVSFGIVNVHSVYSY